MSVAKKVSRGTVERGWWNMACFNALSDDQQRRLISYGNLPLGYQPEGIRCHRGAEVAIECQGDESPGPRFLCLPCAYEYLHEMVEAIDVLEAPDA